MHGTHRRWPGAALAIFALSQLCAGAAKAQDAPPSGPPAAPPPPAQPSPPPAVQPTPPPAQPPPPTALGDVGESCRARSDCQPSLKCFLAVCRDPNYGNSCQLDTDCGGRLRCERATCVDTSGSAYGPPPGPPPMGPPGMGPPIGPPPPLQPISRDWSDFSIGDGVHPFGGITVMPGFSFGLDYATSNTTDVLASMMFAFKAGLFFDYTALELEISPVTYLPFLDGGDPLLQMNLSIGTYRELTDGVYWPGRFGLGLVTVNTPTTYFEMRADMLGLAFGIGHVMLDLHFPSIRWVTDFDQGATFSFLFGVGAGYVF